MFKKEVDFYPLFYSHFCVNDDIALLSYVLFKPLCSSEQPFPSFICMYLIRNVRMSDIKMRHITFNFSLLMQETSTSSNTLMHFLRTHTKKNPLNAIVLLFNSMLSIITIAYHNTIV